MDILPAKRVLVYMVNMRGKLAYFPDFVKAFYEPRARTCIIHARDDELHKMTGEASIQTQYGKFNSDPTRNAVWYKVPKHYDEGKNWRDTVEQ